MSPEQADTSNAKEILVTGIAGADVKEIKVSVGTCGSYKGSWEHALPSLLRPKDTAGEWHWNYAYKHENGICRGSNFIDFRPDTCPEKSYSSACGWRQTKKFFSRIGALETDEIVIFNTLNGPAFFSDGKILDTSEAPKADVSSMNRVVLTGAAGKSVLSIRLQHGCPDTGMFAEKTISRDDAVILADGTWEWSYEMDVKNQTLCRGTNDVSLWPNGSSDMKNTQFTSAVGYVPPEKQVKMDAVLKYVSGTIKDVPNDIKPLTINNKDPLYAKACEDPYGLSGESDPSKQLSGSDGKILVPSQPLDSHISVRLRLPTAEEQKKMDVSIAAPVIDFSVVGNTGGVTAIPPLFGRWCNGGVGIYYIRPDRIIVDIGGGFESSAIYELWNGKEWKTFNSIVGMFENPVKVGAVNSKNFTIQETRGCCDTFIPGVIGQWGEAIFDVDTLKIVDMHFRGSPQ